MAGLITSITHTAANGVPIGAEINPKMRKFIVFDTGIFQSILGLKLADVLLKDDFVSINKGAIAELSVGLEIQKAASCYQPQQLYYWHREAKNSNAEVDFIIQQGTRVLPIEVKSGVRGSMHSLKVFMESKRSEKGIRLSQENFSKLQNIDIYPIYAVANLFKT